MLEKKVQYMKWVKVQTFKRFVLWKNVKGGYKESFWPEIDPNLIVDKEIDRKEPKMAKRPRPFQYQ